MTIRVKQLEWLERRRFLEADGYQVCCNGDPYDPDAMYRVKFHGKVICKKIKGVDRAMQWAQTHHERRILSAIEEDRDEVLEQAARVCDDEEGVISHAGEHRNIVMRQDALREAAAAIKRTQYVVFEHFGTLTP